MKQEKGIGSLNILLSVVVMIFAIGLVVMVFALMGSSLQNSSYSSTTSSVANETVIGLNDSVGDYLSKYSLLNVGCSVSIVANATSGLAIPSSNYTLANCLIKGVANSPYLGKNVNVSYSYTYDANTTATGVVAETVSSIATVPTWFAIIITIAVMVVLILLVIIIISAIRGTTAVGGYSDNATA
jgi:hypothetical protein